MNAPENNVLKPTPSFSGTVDANRAVYRKTPVDFTDSVPADAASKEVVGITKAPPSLFLKVSAGAFKPERLPANSLEEAEELVHRQVRSSGVQHVLLYQLVGAIRFVPSSELISPADIEEKLFKEQT